MPKGLNTTAPGGEGALTTGVGTGWLRPVARVGSTLKMLPCAEAAPPRARGGTADSSCLLRQS
eukprot:scaffold116352_cov21-Tisochrysis_lutea.AAC.1